MVFLYCFSLASFLFFSVVQCLQNITIDDANRTAIEYKPASCGSKKGWEQDLHHAYHGGSLSACGKMGATATFKFTGIAVYFLCPLWPYPMNVVVTIDTSPEYTVNLTDPTAPPHTFGNPTISSTQVWSVGDLENVEHTLILKKGSAWKSTLVPFLPVDGFIYTTLDTPSPGSNSTSAPRSSSSITGPKRMTGTIIGGRCAGLALVILILVVSWYRWRRNREQQSSCEPCGQVFQKVSQPLCSRDGPFASAIRPVRQTSRNQQQLSGGAPRFATMAITSVPNSKTNVRHKYWERGHSGLTAYTAVTKSSTNAATNVRYEPSPPSYRQVGRASSQATDSTIVPSSSDDNPVTKLTLSSAANSQCNDVQSESKLRAPPPHPDTNPDSVVVERRREEHRARGFEFARLREMYWRRSMRINGDDRKNSIRSDAASAGSSRGTRN